MPLWGPAKIVIEALNSRNGTFVNKQKIAKPTILKHGDTILVGASTMLSFSMLANRIDTNKKKATISSYDKYTKLLNKRGCLELIKNIHKKSLHKRTSYSVLMIKIDDLDSIENLFCKAESEEIVIHVSKLLKKMIHEDQFLCRYDKSELSIICPSISSLDCIDLAECIRAKIESTKFNNSSLEVNVTVSVGVATYANDVQTDELQTIQDAHNAMKHAMKKGKNCIALANE